MARGFAYLEVNQSTRSLRGTTRNSGLNFLGNRCWIERMLQANGAQKTKNGDLRRQTSSRLEYELLRSLAAKLISARDALGGSALLQLHSRPDSLAARGGYAGSLDCSSRSVAPPPAFTPPTPHAPRPEGVVTLAAAWYFYGGQVSVTAGDRVGSLSPQKLLFP